MEAETEVQEQISGMLRRFEQGDQQIITQVRETTELMLNGILTSLSQVGVEIDNYAWESQYILNGSAKEVAMRSLTSSSEWAARSAADIGGKGSCSMSRGIFSGMSTDCVDTQPYAIAQAKKNT